MPCLSPASPDPLPTPRRWPGPPSREPRPDTAWCGLAVRGPEGVGGAGIGKAWSPLASWVRLQAGSSGMKKSVRMRPSTPHLCQPPLSSGSVSSLGGGFVPKRPHSTQDHTQSLPWQRGGWMVRDGRERGQLSLHFWMSLCLPHSHSQPLG